MRYEDMKTLKAKDFQGLTEVYLKMFEEMLKVLHGVVAMNMEVFNIVFVHLYRVLLLGTPRFLSCFVCTMLVSTSLLAIASPAEESQKSPSTLTASSSPNPSTTEQPVQNTPGKFLGERIIGVLENPDSVESYLVYPELDERGTSDKCQLAGFRIIQSGPKLTTEQIGQFKAIVSDDKSYATSIKKCVFRPELGLLFKKDKQQVEFLLSMGCDKWLFVSADQRKQGDYRDSAKASLLELRDALFPTKSD
jgi:hypothetical protein